jgi:1-phosphofructokinase family hexose kinase
MLFVAANPSVDRLYEVERLVEGEIHRPVASLAVPGGKGLNAARAAATLGGTVTVAGIVGGRAGDWIVERLAAIGIEARMARSSSETRTCVSILDRAGGALTEVYERGEEISGEAWKGLEAIVREELARADLALVGLSGSLPPGAPDDGFARIARLAAAAAQAVSVLVDSYGPALAAVLAERPSVVKLNALEAAQATGSSVACVDTVVAAGAAGTVIRDRGAETVIVTLGAEGAVVVGDGVVVHLAPPAVRGPYSVGSGDAFLGGLAVGMSRGEPIVEAARLGLAAGIANALIPGAGELDPAAIPGLLAGTRPLTLPR